MSIYRESFVKASRKNRRCVGCDNFATIAIGDSYWSCFSAGIDGFDAGGFALCVPCQEHLEICDDCKNVSTTYGIQGVRECIKETAYHEVNK